MFVFEGRFQNPGTVYCTSTCNKLRLLRWSCPCWRVAALPHIFCLALRLRGSVSSAFLFSPYPREGILDVVARSSIDLVSDIRSTNKLSKVNQPNRSLSVLFGRSLSYLVTG